METCRAKCQSPFDKCFMTLMTLGMPVYGICSLTQSHNPAKKSPFSTGSRATGSPGRREASSFKARMGHRSNPNRILPNKVTVQVALTPTREAAQQSADRESLTPNRPRNKAWIVSP